jgi:hypothetical protein
MTHEEAAKSLERAVTHGLARFLEVNPDYTQQELLERVLTVLLDHTILVAQRKKLSLDDLQHALTEAWNEVPYVDS